MVSYSTRHIRRTVRVACAPTYKMFDTERFILEVRNRVCLWDSREKSFSDRTEKKQAWEEIGKILYASWEDEKERKQQEFVEELQKKWKHLRDYHVKEKKQENTRSRSAAPKKRKSSYIDLLCFLNAVKESRISSGNISAPVDDSINDSTENTCDEPSTNINSQHKNENSASSKIDAVPEISQTSRKSEMTPFQQNLICTMNKIQRPPKEDDSDTQFLLSLLPQIKSLDERQNCEFRMEVMNSIYKIKYHNPYNMS
ncbi:uncharacterized protein LOC143920081 [Arctopsyche grandis]|uniref:uncharacterized protein LOC143920081 n=1 Tax=Arctopsyche grandis TaxID=121162 RepID=UPI00406D7BA3